MTGPKTLSSLMLLAALAALGCRDATAPREIRSLTPGGPSLTTGDNSSWTYSSISVDYVRNDVYCLGEPVHFYGSVPFRYHQATSSSGNFQYHMQFVPQTPNLPPFVGVGLVSGRVFTYNNGGPSNEIYHLGPGESITAIANETYRGSDGTTLGDTYRLHITTNANGVITVQREVPVSFTCK
jgi:hypothetical protein